MIDSNTNRVNEVTDHGCFGCGEQNEIGLKLQFFRVHHGVEATFRPSKLHEGYFNMTHGGIVATVLDEAMSWAVIDTGRLAVTTRMSLEFRNPVPSRAELTVRAWVTRDRRRAVEVNGELLDSYGSVLVSASGMFVRVSDEQQREWETMYVNREGRRSDDG